MALNLVDRWSALFKRRVRNRNAHTVMSQYGSSGSSAGPMELPNHAQSSCNEKAMTTIVLRKSPAACKALHRPSTKCSVMLKSSKARWQTLNKIAKQKLNNRACSAAQRATMEAQRATQRATMEALIIEREPLTRNRQPLHTTVAYHLRRGYYPDIRSARPTLQKS